MAWNLFRLGRWSFRHRRLVAGAWVGLLVLVGIGAVTLSGPTNDDFELTGIESTDAFALIKERVPQAAPDGATARIVFAAPDGEALTDPAHRAAVTDALAAARTGQVSGV